MKIDVLATKDLNQLTFQVLAKGDVIVSEVLQVANATQAQFEFQPSLAMVPNAHVVAYYVTSDGEIVSDFKIIKFRNDLMNFVRQFQLNLDSYFKISLTGRYRGFRKSGQTWQRASDFYSKQSEFVCWIAGSGSKSFTAQEGQRYRGINCL